MKRALFILVVACGPNVHFEPLGSPPKFTSIGDTPNWTLTEGIATGLSMKPPDAHVAFVADNPQVVSVQETTKKGVFIVVPLASGRTILRLQGDVQGMVSVDVRAQ